MARSWLGLLLLAPLPASALSLRLVSTDTPHSGITVRQYRTSSPTTDAWVASIDLCTNGIYMEATRRPDGNQDTSDWAGDVGVELATNGDFYKTSPTRVYGDAVGSGVRWPSTQLGWHSSNAGEWWYEHYGWIAFTHDGVEFTHTGWVKENADDFGGLSAGWRNDDVTPPLPPGTLALVSGFPELVVEGRAMTCSSPTASSCFPDRSDMRARHPRSAMGLTADRSTMLLAVVDGRSSRSDGMYGSELADLMSQVGAWVAFNIDGGGSSTMYVRGDGVLNEPSDGSERAVANHWGVYAGTGNGLPARPGHCVTAAPCGTIPAAGGTIDDGDACFRAHGPASTWRSVTTRGNGGDLKWTNAFDSSLPENWAWWQLHMEEAGTYRVEVYIDAEYGVYSQVPYGIRHAGTNDEILFNQGAGSGWRTLGTWDFAAGGDQWVAVYDDHDGSVSSNQHVVADGLRVVRVGDWCGDGACTGPETCGTCPAECAPGTEVAGNGLDDDCDGSTDEGSGGQDTGGDTSVGIDTGDTAPSSDTSPTGDSALPAGDTSAWDSAPVGLPGQASRIGGTGCGCASAGAGGSTAAGGVVLVLGTLLARRRRRG